LEKPRSSDSPLSHCSNSTTPIAESKGLFCLSSVFGIIVAWITVETLMAHVALKNENFRPYVPAPRGVVMKTQGEIEAAICEGVSRFEQDYMGRGPKDIYAHLLGDLLVVRLQGVLTAAEQHLVKSLSADKGRDLLKQVRTHLIETARPVMESMVQEITGVKVLTLHHDISTVTGEEVVLFTLAESPILRDAKKK
jgi:uncharacterized protein YbcI